MRDYFILQETHSSYRWSHLAQNKTQFYVIKKIIAFDFIILSDLDSNPNNLDEIFFIRVFLIDFLVF